METLFVLPLSASVWMSDHPIAMLIFAVIWLVLFILLIRWVFKIGFMALIFVITFFLPFDFSYED
ncbi:hypothetical protein [Phocaeicola coprocola]